MLVASYIDSIDWELDGLTVDEAISFLQDQKERLIGTRLKKADPPIEQLKLAWEPRDYKDGYVLNLVGLREETDAEEAKRLLAAKQQKEQAEARDRRYLAALQKKYSK